MAGDNIESYPRQETSESLQKILDENVRLIHQLLEFQKEGNNPNPNFAKERQNYSQKLHQNLIYLATLADSVGSSAVSVTPQANGGTAPTSGTLMPSNIPVNGVDGAVMPPPQHGPMHLPHNLVGYGPAGLPASVGYRMPPNPAAVIPPGMRAYSPYRQPPQGHMNPHLRQLGIPPSATGGVSSATGMPSSADIAMAQRLAPSYHSNAVVHQNSMYVPHAGGMQQMQPPPPQQVMSCNMPPPGMIPNYIGNRSGMMGVGVMPPNVVNGPALSPSPVTSTVPTAAATVTEVSSPVLKNNQGVHVGFHQMNASVPLE